MHVREKSSKGFQIKIQGEYHDLHVQKNTLLLDDVFLNFRNITFEIYELGPARVRTALVLAWQAALNKNSNIRIINWEKYVLNDKKGY